MHKRGFTLIELLVVIAIIGILASIVLVSLQGGRTAARDAQRVANLQSMSQAVELADTDPPTAFVGCTKVAGKRYDVSTCTTPNLSQFKDPSTSGTVCAASLASITSTCQFGLTDKNGSAVLSNISTQDWEVVTYLEVGTGSFTAGVACIGSSFSSVTQSSCQ